MKIRVVIYIHHINSYLVFNILLFAFPLSYEPPICCFHGKMLSFSISSHTHSMEAWHYILWQPRAQSTQKHTVTTAHPYYSFFPSKTLPSKPFDICQFVRKYCPNANFAVLQRLMRMAESFLFVSVCTCVTLYLCMCVCLLGLSS